MTVIVTVMVRLIRIIETEIITVIVAITVIGTLITVIVTVTVVGTVTAIVAVTVLVGVEHPGRKVLNVFMLMPEVSGTRRLSYLVT